MAVDDELKQGSPSDAPRAGNAGPPATVLVLNAGSSSLKFALYEGVEGLPLLLKGAISSLTGNPRLSLSAAGEEAVRRPLGSAAMDIAAAVRLAAAELRQRGLLGTVVAVGHRIVHGGRSFTSATVLDADAIDRLRELVPLAPTHQPRNLEIVALAQDLLPSAVQVGCFDTAFHAARPQLAKLYGLPMALADEGLQSYGFHGLSYASIAAALRKRCGPGAGGRTIVAHLGSGASLCAMQEGQSVATTMGFSPLDGLVMSTRCGALDPGVVLHLLQERGMRPEDVTRLLYEQSGLLGVSGISGDMRVLLGSDDPRAALALDLFVYRAGREIGSLAAALGGLDTIVFTAGIGENSPAIRERIAQAAAWLGVRIDAECNIGGETFISVSGSAVDVLILPADEEGQVAQEVLGLLRT